MAEFRRLISYIYEYEGKVKGKNVGFVKLEARNGLCKLNVNVKKLYMGSENMGVYLLTATQEIFLGNIFLRNGCGEFRTLVQVIDVEESGESMDECYGLTIHEKKDNWRNYTTIWEDAVAQAAQLVLEPITSENAVEKEIEKQMITPMIPEIEEEPEKEEGKNQPSAIMEMVEDFEMGRLEIETEQPDVPLKMTLSQALEEKASREQEEEKKEKNPSDYPGWEEIASIHTGFNTQNQENTCSDKPPQANANPIRQNPMQIQPVSPPQGNGGSVRSPAGNSALIRGLGLVRPAVGNPNPVSMRNTNPVRQNPLGQPGVHQPSAPPGHSQEKKEEKKPIIHQYKEEPIIVGDPEALVKLDEEDAEKKQMPIWDFFWKTYPKIQAFDSQHGCQILVIKPQDIGLLPREIWIYGNNSFLLHGYYNYRYLILARLENPKGEPRYLLGVPGHYYSNEKYMASMFGFPNFVLSKKQPAQDGRFGYWYTDIRLAEGTIAAPVH